jgi:stage II sporulation protein P
VRYRLLVVFTTLLILGTVLYGSVHVFRGRLFLTELDERIDGGYFTVLDPQGRVLLQTGRVLSVGDEFITAAGEEYVIYRLQGDYAYARPRRGATRTGRHDPAWYRIWLGRVEGRAAQGRAPGTVGILHTHSAESYVPSDGTESQKTGGGILQVGQVFAGALKEQGLRVIHDTTSHVPHDAGAYTRSRRTAAALLRQNVDAIFDVHRDAAPPEAYQTQIDGRPATHILLVVGRQNPNLAANRSFAQELKNAVNAVEPGLVKGILTARGRYNQDLFDRMVILEVGAHTNRREDAKIAVTTVAQAVPAALNRGGAARAVRGRIAWTTLAWLVVGVAAALFAYLYLATGSWQEFRSKLRDFLARRWPAGVFRRAGPRS